MSISICGHFGAGVTYGKKKLVVKSRADTIVSLSKKAKKLDAEIKRFLFEAKRRQGRVDFSELDRMTANLNNVNRTLWELGY